MCNGFDDDCDGFDDFAGSCPDYVGAFTGPFTLTMTGDGLYTCEGTADLTIDLLQSPVVQGTYSCTFDGTDGWDAFQTGSLDGTLDEAGNIEGTFDTLGGETYLWFGDANPPRSGNGQGLWIDGLVSWQVEASWTQDHAAP